MVGLLGFTKCEGNLVGKESSIDLNAKLPSRSSNFPGEGCAGSENMEVVDVLVQLIFKISLNAICFKFDRKAL